MTAWKLERCTVDDAAALARNNMSAFWEDPTWILLWPEGTTREFLIEQCAKRQARNMLRNREQTRHIKAVDPSSGKLVGYARWILPPGHTVRGDGAPEWEEGQVPDVSDDEKRRFEELALSARWDARSGVSGMDDKNYAVMNPILAEKPYIKLDYLAVHPENKGRGVGTALVANGIRQSERIRLPIFAMAYKAGLGIYTRLGFKEVNRVIQDNSLWGGVGEYGAYFMIYDPFQVQ
ncbi:acyl-CoA N-acyltransferase [Xylaria cf. heliscus]|nr:acyl-CoA N-acyltransferase [Xylaria cf. heliscus]